MPSGTTSSERPRVLLVDDNADVLARATAVLAPGCVVLDAVCDGAAAIDAERALAQEVVVLDISMPGMSGFEVAAQLRANGSTAAVVFLTVHEDREFVDAAQALGGLGYVVKARLGTDLMRAVHEARGRRAFGSKRA